MNLIKKITTAALLIFVGLSANAQKTPNYGENPDKCKEKLTIMITYHKQKAYDDAASSWRWCFNNCPQSSKNIYIVGEKIMRKKIKDLKGNKEERAKYIDSLILVLDKRIEYYPGKGKNVFSLYGKKGKALATYKAKTHYKEAYSLLDTTINALGSKTPAGIAQAYMFTVNKRVKKGELNCNDMITAYLKVLDIVNQNIDKKPKAYKALKENALEAADKCLDCNILDSIYTVDFPKYQNDTLWLDGGIELLTEKKCSKSEVLVKMMEKRYETSPSSKTAIKLAQYFGSKKEKEKAMKFYDEAIATEKDTAQLIKHMIKKAKYQNNSGQAQGAMATANKVLSIEPNNAKAWTIKGDAVVFGAASCKSLQFDGAVVYWVAVDYYNKAAAVATDADVKSKAISKAGKYSAYFPLQDALFLQSLNDGDSYTVGCWLNAKTTVRKKK